MLGSQVIRIRRHAFRYGMLVWIALALQGGAALADPEPLNDRDLDEVSARGYSVPGFSFNSNPMVTSVFPFAPTSGENDTDIKNLLFGSANNTTVNTIVNTCVFSDCENANTSIESSPVATNVFDIANQVAPTLQNVVSVPTITNSTVNPPGAAPAVAEVPVAPSMTAPQIRHGIVRAPPPLPTRSLTIQR